MAVIWFDLCAVVILIIILAVFYQKDKMPVLQNKIFLIMVWCVLFSTLCDFLSGYWQNQILREPSFFQHIPVGLYYFINYLYFLTRNLTPFFYAFYIMAILNITDLRLSQKLFLYAPVCITLGLILLTPFWGCVFYLDERGMYHRGAYLMVLYGIAAYYLFYAVYFVFSYRGAISLTRRLAFYSFVSLALGTVLIQGVYPSLLVEGFGTTLCLLLIYLTIQKPEEVMDGETGFFNKAAFFTMLTIRFRQQAEFRILIISLDDIPFLKNSLGRANVNMLLKAMLAYLRQSIRKASFYRVAEGQLCILFDRKQEERNMQILSDMIDRFSQPWTMGELVLSVPAFFVSAGCPEEAKTQEQVEELLDLLQRKSGTGLNGLISMETLDLPGWRRRKKIDSIVKTAVENKLLQVKYQPIYSTAEHRYRSAEALVRLYDPQLGPVPPAEFIPIAEENGAILKIGKFVLHSVCRFLSEHDVTAAGLQYIEINLSIVECLQENLPDIVDEVIRDYGISPGQINFEITETASESVPAVVQHNMEKLVAAGFHFSMDDYGTGYSNMRRMLTLPLDIIKIDKSILPDRISDETNRLQIFLSHTFSMLRRLDKKVLIEGVETEEQARFVIALGCHYIQGFYYARPMEEQDFIRFLAEHNRQEI